MDRVRERIHLTELQEYMGNKTPLTIAVLDSGICNHPDLVGKCIAFQDFVNNEKKLYDDSGHGTHVSGILCGSGEASEGKYKGIFPAARLVVGKVLDAKGEGLAEHMIQALDWVLSSRKNYDIRLLNISVGIGGLKDKQKAEKLVTLTEQLWDAGVIVVCAAGNKGPAEGSISAIGGLGKVITVGCFDDYQINRKGDGCERYSGRGRKNSNPRKPDLVAPGSNIISCCHEFNWRENEYKKLYTAKSGTSMATPIITGCAALLLQRAPYLTNEEIKQRLHYTAEDLGKPWNLQGWGMVDVGKLLELQ